MTTPRNREQYGVKIGLVIAAAGAGLVLLPSLSDMSMMSGGYALQFIGLFVAITGVIILWFYRARAATLQGILAGDGLLAHWTLDPTEVRRNAAAQLAEEKDNNRALFLITAFLLLVIGIPVLIVPAWRDLMRGDSVAVTIVGCYLAVIPVLGLFAWGMPRLSFRRALEDGGDVYIGQDGVFVNGALHTWRQPFSGLKQVKINRHAGTPSLDFDIRYLTRLGTIHYTTNTVRVPVPRGQEDKAQELVRFFADGRSHARTDGQGE